MWAYSVDCRYHVLRCTVRAIHPYNSSAESKKGLNAVQRCSVQNQKGAVARLCTTIAPCSLEGRNRQTCGDFHGWPDSGKLWWSTCTMIYVRPCCSSLRLHCSNAHACFRANEYMHISTVRLYFVQLAVTSRHKIHYCMFKDNRWIKIDHPWSSSQVHFPSAQIILPSQLEILAKITEIRVNIKRRFAHHIFQLRASSCTDMSGPAGCNQLLPLKFRGCATEPLDRNYRSFMHNSCTLLKGTQI